MQHEALILRTLMVASVLVCGLIVGNMFTSRGTAIQLADAGTDTHERAVTGAMGRPGACAIANDGVVCLRAAA